MTPQQWHQLKDLLARAADMAPARQRAFIREQAGDDLELTAHALALLDEETTQTKTRSGNPLRDLFEKRDGSEYHDMEIGPYRVVRELGRGGMGVVLLARDTAHGDREVAVKILRRGMEGRDTVLRFRHERIILSELDHPNIASLLDGGTTHEGLHYLVMDYVHGQPLDTYCDSLRLNTRDRLQLFAKVCDAMAYAHARQVVHRDLKPANILVTADGEPVILDFGIAKMNNPESLAHAPLTATGQWLMTPEYASPEQVRGDTATPACDVYALGVLLYELLSGRRPYVLEQTGPLELARIICEEEPPRPSKILEPGTPRNADDTVETRLETLGALRGTHPELLRRELRGDLDRLVMSAIAKNAAGRYADAAALVRDVRGYLEGRGVEGTETSFLSRAGKWLSRNKPVMQAAYTVVLLLSGFGFARLTGDVVPLVKQPPSVKQR